MLYCPASFSADKLLRNFEASRGIDSICLDLEDSVTLKAKPQARDNARQVLHALASRETKSERLIRINSLPTGLAEDDIAAIRTSEFDGVVIPKVRERKDIEYVIKQLGSPKKLIASIESAYALMHVQEIATTPNVAALLFAAEDYCADTSIRRTKHRQELLFARSAIVNAARAYNLQSIDMVCINFRDAQVLEEEAEEGRNLGFDGKQAIHPKQVEAIQRVFAPSEREIARAVAILEQNELAEQVGKGAFAFEEGGSSTMIDAPMLLQARAVLRKALQAGLSVPWTDRIDKDVAMNKL